MKSIYVFLRTPKTGSTTFIKHVERSENNKGMCLKSKYNSGLSLSAITHKKFVYGHYLTHPLPISHENINFRYITLIRDPADWLLSIYHHICRSQRLDIPFWEWYFNGRMDSPHGGDNPLYHWFEMISIGKTPFEMLEQCWFVGLTEASDIVFPWLLKLLDGLELSKRFNVGRKVYSLTNNDRQQIYSLNPLDVALYEHAVRLFKTKYRRMITT